MIREEEILVDLRINVDGQKKRFFECFVSQCVALCKMWTLPTGIYKQNLNSFDINCSRKTIKINLTEKITYGYGGEQSDKYNYPADGIGYEITVICGKILVLQSNQEVKDS